MTDGPDKTDAERPLPSATVVIEAFGGIRPMAAKLDIPVTTVQGWKERDSIPKRRWAEIRRVAEAQAVKLDEQPEAETQDVIAMPADKGAESRKVEGAETQAGKPQATTPAAPLGATPWAATGSEDKTINEKTAAENAAAAKSADAKSADAKSAADKPPADKATGDKGTKTPLQNASRDTAKGDTRSAPPPQTPPPTPPRAARRGLGAWPWIILVLIVGGAAVTWDIWWPKVEKEANLAGIFSSTQNGSEATDEAGNADSVAPSSSASTAEVEAPTGGSTGTESSTASPTSPSTSAPTKGTATESQSVEAEIAALKESLRRLQAGSGGGADSRIAALEKQIQGLSGTVDTRFSGLESRGATKAVESALAELRAENARLTEQLTALRKSLQAMEQRLDAAEKRAGGEQVLMLAVGQLRAALARGAPFRQELSALEGLSAEDESLAETIAPLWSYASIGVETEAELRARFDSLAPEVLSAEQGAAGGWTDRILAKLNDVVTIRRVGGDVEGDGADALLARAEASLTAGDLAGAVEIMGGLKGPAAAAAASWLADARARLAANKAVAALETRVLAERAPDEG